MSLGPCSTCPSGQIPADMTTQSEVLYPHPPQHPFSATDTCDPCSHTLTVPGVPRTITQDGYWGCSHRFADALSNPEAGA